MARLNTKRCFTEELNGLFVLQKTPSSRCSLPIRTPNHSFAPLLSSPPAMAGRLAGASSPLPRALLILAIVAIFSIFFLFLRSLGPAAAPSLSVDESRRLRPSSSSPSSSSPATSLPSVYHSPEVFAAGYAEMERSFKVYIYPDGDPKTFYQTPRKLTGKLLFSNSFCSVSSVILSNYYDLPFNDVLDWRKFAVVLKERDVYELKSILKSKSQEEFVALHKSLVQVQKHFVWHSPPVPYDAFHMVMYELWLRHHVIKY
uniref:Uncharacterized protein n=1 Tax=Avena sativa TaxID=4498 RepID=A0ACD5V6I1_AVESA